MAFESHAPRATPGTLGLRSGVRWLRQFGTGNAAPAARPPAAEPVPAPPPLPRPRAVEGPRTIADVPLLVARLRGLGHTTWLEDRIGGAAVPADLSATVFGVLADAIEVIGRDGRPGQTLSIHLRVEDAALVVSLQNGGRYRVEPPDLDDADLAPLRRRIEAAGGEATVLPTAGGYWIAIARFPLRD